MRLYLDVCCLNRPFDDPQVDRNRLEAEAVLAIIGRIRGGRHLLISSEAIDREVDACPDGEKAELVRRVLQLADEYVSVAAKDVLRWRELMALGFHTMDALHLACAESAHCHMLLTTDDKLIKRAKSRTASLRIRLLNPLTFVTEVER